MRGFQKGCPAVRLCDGLGACWPRSRAFGAQLLFGGPGREWGVGKRIKARGGGHRAVGLCAAYGQETAQASPQATANAGLCGCPRKAFPPLAKKEGRCAAAGCRAGQRRRGRGAFHWGAKANSTSFEPESNQRPKDDHTNWIYSPPLYQLSYRRVRATKWPGTLLFPETAQHHTGTLVGSPFEESGARAARVRVRVRGPDSPVGWLRPGLCVGRHRGSEFQDASFSLRRPSFYKWGPRPESEEEG